MKLEEIEERWKHPTKYDPIVMADKAIDDIAFLLIEVKRLQSECDELREERDGAIEGWKGREKAINQAIDGIVKLKAEVKRLRETIEIFLKASEHTNILEPLREVLYKTLEAT